ncbi:T6SS effector BTH_I2691 family protein [Orbaceae bacterium ac157xtp]
MSNNNELVTCGCQQEGLAIFPVRYTVVPAYINRKQPSWANLPGVTDVQLQEDYHYHVRKVRSGFIYIYLPSKYAFDEIETNYENLSEPAKIELEKKHWLIYAIDEQGRFVKQTTVHQVQPVNEHDQEFKCPSLMYNPSLTSFITIPNSQLYDKIYIAFSDFPLTVEALQDYRKSPLPRMQEIDLNTWRSKKEQQSAVVATEHTLGQILDYDFEFIFTNTSGSTTSLIYNGQDDVTNDKESNSSSTCKEYFSRKIFKKDINTIQVPKILSQVGDSTSYTSDEQDYYYNEIEYDIKYDNLKLNTTKQRWSPFQLGNLMTGPETDATAIFKNMHDQHLHTLSKNMQNYSAQHGSPMILALEDALGVADDLNGYYNDIYGHLAQFEKEASMECDVKHYLEKIKAYVSAKEAKKDFDIAPNKDDLYIAISRQLDLDDVEYKQEILIDKMKKKYPQQNKELTNFHVFHLMVDKFDKDSLQNVAKILKLDIDEAPPIKREFYKLIKSYILLVKDHFYGKPFGHIYYERYMNYLKYNQDFESVFIIKPKDERTGKELNYDKNSIYAQFIKYSTFLQNATKEELIETTLKLHQIYQKLVTEYAAKEEELKQKFKAQVNKALKKYTSCLRSDDFDRAVAELDEIAMKYANERAKQLIKWLEKSHYLNFINDLSYEQKTELSSLGELGEKYQKQLREELQTALDKEEINPEQFEELKCINLNGLYFKTVFENTIMGLEACEAGQEFTKKLFDLKQFKEIEVNSRVHIKTNFWVLGVRGITHDSGLVFPVLKQIYTSVDEEKKKKYRQDILNDLEIKGLSWLVTKFRVSTLALEHFKELQHLQKVYVPTQLLTLDTTFGQKKIVIKWFANYNKTGAGPSFILGIYDSLISLCSPFGKGLFSMGAVIAEAASLALAGVIWSTATVYAHLKYQLMEAWVTFKSQSMTGIDIGGGFKLLPNAYPQQAKNLIKKLRESLNTVIKQLDSRLVDNLVEIEQYFKNVLNIPFKVFSDEAKKRISRNKLKLRSTKLALIVGAFELYSWNYIMDKEPSLFENDYDILMEKMSATTALFAATADVVASTASIFRTKYDMVFVYAKVSVGIFGGLVNLLAAGRMAQNTWDEFKRGNMPAAMLGFLSSSLYATSGSLQALWGLSYRYEWVQTFLEKKLATTIAKKGVQKAFNLIALRFILLRLTGIIGFAALVLELIYDWLSDDEIQVWLKYSALGSLKMEQKYKASIDQALAFEAISTLKSEVEEKTGINLSEKLNQSFELMEQDHETTLLEIENQAIKWLLPNDNNGN